MTGFHTILAVFANKTLGIALDCQQKMWFTVGELKFMRITLGCTQ